MVRGDWGDRRRLAYQALEAEALEAEVLEVEALEAEALEVEALEVAALEEVRRTHHPVEVEMVAGVRQGHLAAVRGRCQNRQIQEEGGLLRARKVRLPALALAAVNLNIRAQPEKKGGKAEWKSCLTLTPTVRHSTSRS